MYCRKCGKVIPDDSMFCQYCGEQLSYDQPAKKQERKGLISRFQSLSKGWQICLMSYVCWIFLWIILCVSGTIYDDQGIYTLLFIFMLPILALFVWYYLTHLRKMNRERIKPKAEQHKEVKLSSVPVAEQGYSVFSLLLFAKTFGKMQVKIEKDGDGNTLSYCIFTNPDGVITKVDFGETTSDMTATEISKYKEVLYVVQNPEGSYKLVRL